MNRPNGPLHVKYRPQCFEEVFGNKGVIDSLKLIFSRDKDRPTSYLFYGPAGCGKTTFARLMKKYLDVADMDFTEFNAANTRGIDTVRGVISSSVLSPLSGKLRMYFFDECHAITRQGEEALLKTLESPPKSAVFVLCTTNPEKLLSTTIRRLASFQLKLLDFGEIMGLLAWVCKEENVDVGGIVLKRIAQVCDGSPGSALKILDQVIDFPSDDEALVAVENVYVSEKQVIDICRLLLETGKRWPRMAKLVKEVQVEPEEARYAIMGYLSAVLLGRESDDRLSLLIDCFLESFMYSKRAGLVNALYNACKL